MARSSLSRLHGLVAETLDRVIGWDKLPRPLGLFTLVGLRQRLRRLNLHDTSEERDHAVADELKARYLTARTPDGTYNDLDKPWMGSAKMPFGRNVPLENANPDNEWRIRNSPNPRTVSRKLLTRNDGFQPVEGLNLLAGSWLQFMVRDWLGHGKGKMDRPWELEREEGDDWPEEKIKIPRTPRHSEGPPPTYTNEETHWWDGSQIYGSNEAFQEKVRTGSEGKVRTDPEEIIPLPSSQGSSGHPVDRPGFWLGLDMLNRLFAMEHNAICEKLREEYSWTDDDELFERARLVNAALLAKIHTVEWTPAILGHPTLQIAMGANWWGLAGKQIHKLLGRISESEVWSGIPGSETDHFDVPYSITEEFVAVYRMHPLIPDDYDFRSADDNRSLKNCKFPNIVNREGLKIIKDEIDLGDLFYSFGTSHPGKIVLHNFPESLQQFKRPDGALMDLAATDILRTREFGVPRYNEFRRLLRLRPAKSFEDLTDNDAWAREMREVYNDDIESVDLTVGMYAERFPEGFGFSDTAFRIFILMASRRLNSDRFFTTHYTPGVYTEVGMRWIEDNDMISVLLRHYPQLRPSLSGIKNAFFPWNKTGPEKEPASTTRR